MFLDRMNEKNGRMAVKIARKTIDLWVRSREKFDPKTNDYPKGFDDPAGVFVTLHTHPSKELRGCIGFPEPRFPLIKALIEAAVASTQDPRFPPLEEDELGKVVVEVSVLTKPDPIRVKDPKDYPKKVRIGKDGLIVRRGIYSGLLLPQVAPEHNLDEKSFLSHTCLKAGLPPDSWMEKGIDIFRFQSLIFSEKNPGK